MTKRLIVGISGASGSVFGIRTLELLKRVPIETHLVMSRSALVTVASETTYSIKQIHKLADVVYRPEDIGAAISSGSFRTLGMIIVPCSIKSLSEVAYGNTSTLLTRAADVVLKERRTLILAVRETPLHLGHLKTMVRAAEAGAVVAPLMPAFYSMPETIQDLVDHSIGRMLDQFDIDIGSVKRWGGTQHHRGRQPRQSTKLPTRFRGQKAFTV
jgi:4-hydroxy-3-polyprenylbenzoate decarboxylase